MAKLFQIFISLPGYYYPPLLPQLPPNGMISLAPMPNHAFRVSREQLNG